MLDFPADIYTEPDADVDTLKNLGPLTGMAGIWKSAGGEDVHPTAGGPEPQAFIERYELQPIDPQTNGPQLLYGLRYHTHIVKPDSVETFHDQVGYWLWEAATGTVFYTLCIPRAQIAMAVGHAASDAKAFRLEAVRGSETHGIVSNPFLERAFKTLRVTIDVTIHRDGTWSYEQDTVMIIPGAANPFHHTDRNTLRKIGEPTPNPLAVEGPNRSAQPRSLGIGSLRTTVPRREDPAADAPRAGPPDALKATSTRIPTQ
ncbi:MAG: heme-binding beta-barrel domain-containing protein [Polyangiaceae bacterium]|jgi:hypothetical protein